MGLSLNHFSIRTLDMDATQNFYSKVLGLTAGRWSTSLACIKTTPRV
jgi:predicted enzyme related to lactoylglutathione lyase